MSCTAWMPTQPEEQTPDVFNVTKNDACVQSWHPPLMSIFGELTWEVDWWMRDEREAPVTSQQASAYVFEKDHSHIFKTIHSSSHAGTCARRGGGEGKLQKTPPSLEALSKKCNMRLSRKINRTPQNRPCFGVTGPEPYHLSVCQHIDRSLCSEQYVTHCSRGTASVVH